MLRVSQLPPGSLFPPRPAQTHARKEQEGNTIPPFSCTGLAPAEEDEGGHPESPAGQDPGTPPHPSCLSVQGDSRRDRATTHPPEVPAGGRGPPLAPNRPSSPPGAPSTSRGSSVHLQQEGPRGRDQPPIRAPAPSRHPQPGNSLENSSGRQTSSLGFHSGFHFTCPRRPFLLGSCDPASAPARLCRTHSGCSASALPPGGASAAAPQALLYKSRGQGGGPTSPS